MDREKHLKRVRGLMSVTTMSGASEQEAMTAAALARDYMTKYQIDAGELSLADETVQFDAVPFTWLTEHFLQLTMPLISEFCDVRFFKNTNKDGKTQYVFGGLQSDMELARWLFGSLSEFVVTQTTKYIHEQKPTGEVLSASEAQRRVKALEINFVNGISVRIAYKLERLIADKAVTNRAANALVVIKHDKTDAALAEIGINLGPPQKLMNYFKSTDAFIAGAAAGANAQLGRPVEDKT